MEQTILNYDEISDTLYISFSPGEKATGIELNDHILLRINRDERRAVGIAIFDYCLLAQKTDLGPRSFPLSGLNELPGELRDIICEVLLSEPVNKILSLSAYTPSVVETIPILTLRQFDGKIKLRETMEKRRCGRRRR